MSTTGQNPKRLLKWLGNSLAVSGVIFVCLQLWQHGTEVRAMKISDSVWLLVALCSIGYAVANITLVCAWNNILKFLGQNISGRTAFSIYGISQLAKYAPGNVFHLAGRQALGIAAGLNGWQLAKSAAYELGLITVAGLSCALLVIPQSYSDNYAPVSAVLLLGFTVVLALLLKKLLNSNIARAYLQQLAFLLCSGLIFAVLVIELGGQPHNTGFGDLAMLAGVFIVAWTVGLITPGAPAGAGVREIILLAFLAGTAEEATILAAVLLSRFITVTGDLLLFVTASLSKKGPRGQAPSPSVPQ